MPEANESTARWVEKGVAALGKMQRNRSSAGSAATEGFTIKKQNTQFMARHFDGMWLAPDDPLRLGADPDGADLATARVLVIAPAFFYPDLFRQPRCSSCNKRCCMGHSAWKHKGNGFLHVTDLPSATSRESFLVTAQVMQCSGRGGCGKKISMLELYGQRKLHPLVMHSLDCVFQYHGKSTSFTGPPRFWTCGARSR